MILRVKAPYFVAGSVWKHKGDQLICESAAPIIKWMVGKEIGQVAKWLDRKGFEYRWLG